MKLRPMIVEKTIMGVDIPLPTLVPCFSMEAILAYREKRRALREMKEEVAEQSQNPNAPFQLMDIDTDEQSKEYDHDEAFARALRLIRENAIYGVTDNTTERQKFLVERLIINDEVRKATLASILNNGNYPGFYEADADSVEEELQFRLSLAELAMRAIFAKYYHTEEGLKEKLANYTDMYNRTVRTYERTIDAKDDMGGLDSYWLDLAIYTHLDNPIINAMMLVDNPKVPADIWLTRVEAYDDMPFMADMLLFTQLTRNKNFTFSRTDAEEIISLVREYASRGVTLSRNKKLYAALFAATIDGTDIMAIDGSRTNLVAQGYSLHDELPTLSVVCQKISKVVYGDRKHMQLSASKNLEDVLQSLSINIVIKSCEKPIEDAPVIKLKATDNGKVIGLRGSIENGKVPKSPKQD